MGALCYGAPAPWAVVCFWETLPDGLGGPVLEETLGGWSLSLREEGQCPPCSGP